LPSMHMNDHGITLRHGEHKGRLVRPTRWYAGKNESARWPQHYTNAMYSDDNGKTWKASDPFPAFGTGEATVAELSDGTVYYNSRRHWAPEGENPRRRWTATSDDGGVTWKNLTFCKILPDGPQNTNYGCMGGLTRLAIEGQDILLYCNCESEAGRNHGTVWASFDGGKSWPIKRLIFAERFGYSSMTSGRPGTNTEGLVFVHFEGGPKGGSTVARFNLNWILGGEKTGDGEVPKLTK
jgi:sialidase-1